MNYGGENYTGFSGVNLKNTGAIRLKLDGGLVGTLSVKASPDADRAWQFPDKSGTFPISGTFTVNLPAVDANEIYGTSVTVSGIRVEDAIVSSIQNMTTTGIGTRGFVFIGGCQAANGGVYITFVNATNTATVYKDVVIAYTTVR